MPTFIIQDHRAVVTVYGIHGQGLQQPCRYRSEMDIAGQTQETGTKL